MILGNIKIITRIIVDFENVAITKESKQGGS
jgi:hypothetical protein